MKCMKQNTVILTTDNFYNCDNNKFVCYFLLKDFRLIYFPYSFFGLLNSVANYCHIIKQGILKINSAFEMYQVCLKLIHIKAFLNFRFMFWLMFMF